MAADGRADGGMPQRAKNAGLLPEGLTALHQVVARYKAADRLAPSPALGQLTRAEYDNFHQRHAEMHLSFRVPQR